MRAHEDPRFGQRIETEHRPIAEVAGNILAELTRDDPGTPPASGLS